MEHTKGEWTVHPVRCEEEGGRTTISIEEKSNMVGTDVSRGPAIALLHYYPKREKETKANARLIAAAPKMFDALRFARGGLSTEPKIFAEHIRIIDEALAKAE